MFAEWESDSDGEDAKPKSPAARSRSPSQSQKRAAQDVKASSRPSSRSPKRSSSSPHRKSKSPERAGAGGSSSSSPKATNSSASATSNPATTSLPKPPISGAAGGSSLGSRLAARKANNPQIQRVKTGKGPAETLREKEEKEKLKKRKLYNLSDSDESSEEDLIKGPAGRKKAKRPKFRGFGSKGGDEDEDFGEKNGNANSNVAPKLKYADKLAAQKAALRAGLTLGAKKKSNFALPQATSYGAMGSGTGSSFGAELNLFGSDAKFDLGVNDPGVNDPVMDAGVNHNERENSADDVDSFMLKMNNAGTANARKKSTEGAAAIDKNDDVPLFAFDDDAEDDDDEPTPAEAAALNAQREAAQSAQRAAQQQQAQASSSSSSQPSSSSQNPLASIQSFATNKKDRAALQALMEAESDPNTKMREISSAHNFDQGWAQRNPGYVATLTQKEDQAKTESSLVGHMVEAGSTEQVTHTQKRKHQITYLAASAKMKHAELSAAQAHGHAIKKEAGAKYGW